MHLDFQKDWQTKTIFNYMCMCIYIYMYTYLPPPETHGLFFLTLFKTEKKLITTWGHFCGRATVVNRHVLPEIRPSVSGNCLKRPFRFRPWRFGCELPVKNSQFFLCETCENQIRTFQDCFSKCSSLLLASKLTKGP